MNISEVDGTQIRLASSVKSCKAQISLKKMGEGGDSPVYKSPGGVPPVAAEDSK